MCPGGWEKRSWESTSSVGLCVKSCVSGRFEEGTRRGGGGLAVLCLPVYRGLWLRLVCICLFTRGLHLSLYIGLALLRQELAGCTAAHGVHLGSVTPPVLSVAWCPTMSQLWDFAWLLLAELLLSQGHDVKGDGEVLRLQIQKAKSSRPIGRQTFLAVPCVYFLHLVKKKRGCE